jgi:hypothetical protein
MSRFEPRGPRKEPRLIERRTRTYVDNVRDGLIILLLLLTIRILQMANPQMLIGRIPIIDGIAFRIWKFIEPLVVDL